MGILSKIFGVQEVLRIEVECGLTEGRAVFIPLVPSDNQRLQQLLVQAVGLVYGQLHFSVYGSAGQHVILMQAASELAKKLSARGRAPEALVPDGGRLATRVQDPMKWVAVVMARRNGELGIKSQMLRVESEGYVEEILAYAIASAVQRLDEKHVWQLGGVLQGMNHYYERTGDFEGMNSPSRALYAGLVECLFDVSALFEQYAKQIPGARDEEEPAEGIKDSTHHRRRKEPSRDG